MPLASRGRTVTVTVDEPSATNDESLTSIVVCAAVAVPEVSVMNAASAIFDPPTVASIRTTPATDPAVYVAV